MMKNHEEDLEVEKHPNRGSRGWLGKENGTENVELEKRPNRGRGWLSEENGTENVELEKPPNKGSTGSAYTAAKNSALLTSHAPKREEGRGASDTVPHFLDGAGYHSPPRECKSTAFCTS